LPSRDCDGFTATAPAAAARISGQSVAERGCYWKFLPTLATRHYLSAWRFPPQLVKEVFEEDKSKIVDLFKGITKLQ